MDMAIKIAVSNAKGGTSKTTTAVNLGAALAAGGKCVLLVDLDAQAHATKHLGVHAPEITIREAMDGRPADEATYQVDGLEAMYLICASRALANYEVQITTVVSRETLLRDALAPIEAEVDFVLIDCPPNLGIMTLNALTAADYVLVPSESQYFSLEGVAELQNTIALVKRKLNPKLAVLGVVLTMHQARIRHHAQVAEAFADGLGAQIMQTKIRQNVKLSEAAWQGVPIQLYDPGCAGAQDYDRLALEVLTWLDATH